MSENLPPDFAKYFAEMKEMHGPGSPSMTIDAVAKDNTALVEDLERFDGKTTVPLMASLLTLPEHQSQCHRLELLVALALLHCNGTQTPKHRDLADWYQRIGQSFSVSGEDPAEDVFVTLVDDELGDYRLPEGLWEAAGFHTQRVLDVISQMPDNPHYQQIKRSVRAILRLADIVCSRASLTRYQLGSQDDHETLQLTQATDLAELAARVTIDRAMLDSLGIRFVDLKPFLLRPAMLAKLGAQQLGSSALERYPLILAEGNIIVALPTALSVALRAFIIQFVKESEMEDAFDGALAQSYAQLIYDTTLFNGPTRAPIHWKKVGHDRIALVAFDVDVGHILVLLFVLPSVRHHGPDGFMGMHSDEGELSQAIEQSLEKARHEFESTPDFQRGLIVTVVCGWGLGFQHVEKAIVQSRWQAETMSAADLVRLSHLPEMSPDVFWRLRDAEDRVAEAGVSVLNLNGVLNLWGWVDRNDGHIIPHARMETGRITPERPMLLHIPLNLLRDVRARADHGYDRHRGIDPSGASHRLQRASAQELFPDEHSQRTYASLHELNEHRLTCVYEGKLALWLTLAAPNMNDRRIHFELWKMLCMWVARIGAQLPDVNIDPSTWPTSMKVYATFEDSDDTRELADLAIADSLDDMWEVTTHAEAHVARILFKRGFLTGFKDASNIAERAVVRALAAAFLSIAGVVDPVTQARAIEKQVVRSDLERSFHVFRGHSFLDYMAGSLNDDLIAVDRIDDAAARIGLGWRALAVEASEEIKGKEACSQFLGRVVDLLLKDLLTELSSLDRTSTLIRLARNSEVANRLERQWRHTSAAVLALHSDFPDLHATVVAQLSKFAGARITSRVLTELALCTCPLEGGRHASNLTLSKLLAQVSILMRVGGYSDAIHFNALPAEIRVSPLGDILIRDSLGELVFNPMMTRHMSDGFSEDAERYARHYAEQEVAAKIQHAFDSTFWEAWKEEMGFDIDEARFFLDAIDAYGIKRNEAVFLLKRGELIAIGVAAGVPKASVEAFLEQFTLATRAAWDDVPKGFALREVYPWRYGRRLSALTRPLLQIDEATDPTILVAPATLRQGFGYVVDGAHGGRLGQAFFQSAAMRNDWLGRAGEGHTFNHQLAEKLTASGWTVRENIGFPELLQHHLDYDPGDIDILAWRPGRDEVLIIECKDLSLARNYSEVATLLSDYQGEIVDGKPDKLKKHLNRMDLAQKNLSHIAKFTGVDAPTLVSWLVFSGMTPMHYAEIKALEGTHIGLSEDILAY